MPTDDEWVRTGRNAILELLEQEHAIVPLEIVAKLSEGQWPALPRKIDPHHLTTARRQLTREGLIEVVSAPTRGGESIAVLALADRQGRQRAFLDAAARKRLLYARYLNWATHYFGKAGERTVHASLTAAAPRAGYRLFEPSQGEVRRLFGKPVPVGPLDNGALLQVLDAEGFPSGTVAVPIEVKNIHHWIYSESAELYELLDKAAQLALANPRMKFVPVLACRRAHITAFRMAKDLGFFIADARAQFVLPVSEVDPKHVVELRTELGLHDLVRPEIVGRARRQGAEYEQRRLITLFEESLPAIALRAADRFTEAAPVLATLAPQLRVARLRAGLMNQLRAQTRGFQQTGGW